MEQIAEAVRLALDPSTTPEIKKQATEYCEQLRNSDQGWQPCLSLFVRKAPSSQESRLFCLQVLESFIQQKLESKPTEELVVIQNQLIGYVSNTLFTSFYDSQPPFIINKLAHVFALLFLATFPKNWPSFFKDLLSLTGIPYQAAIEHDGNSSNSDSLSVQYSAMNQYATDFTLKVLLAIDDEMVNPVFIRGKKELERNTFVKDEMREESVVLLAQWWYNIILFDKIGSNLIEQTLHLISVYIAWVEKSLIVNDKFLSAIFVYLKHPLLRNEVVNCLASITKKGMPGPEKLELIQYFNFPNIISQLELNNSEFTVEIARLANIAGIEITSILLESNSLFSPNFLKAYQLLESLLPMSLNFLESEDSSVSSTVYGVITEFLTLLKKLQKNGEKLSIPQTRFLFELLQVSIKKMKYDESYSLPETPENNSDNCDISLDEDDEDAIFMNNRRQLKQFVDSISVLIPSEYKSYLLGSISETFLHVKNYGVPVPNQKINSNDSQANLNWTQAELALHLTQIYIEQCSSKGELNFIVNDPAPQKNNTTTNFDGFQNNLPSRNQNPIQLTEFSELALLMINSGIINYSNPLVSLLFFETCVRLSSLFNYCPEAIPLVLEPFLGPRGIHSQHRYVKTRMWYFLLRFVKLNSISKITPYSLEIVNSVAPLLEIQINQSLNQDFRNSGNLGYGIFDSQVYLFETCGMVVSSPLMSDSDRILCLNKILDPIFSTIQPTLLLPPSSFNSQSAQLLLIHHYLVAIGAIAQGFPDAKIHFPNAIPSQLPTSMPPISVEALTKAANLNILVLEAFNSFAIIREGVRVSFSRVLSALGHDALVYLPRLISGLVAFCEIDEFSDLLGFLGLVMFRFKSFVTTTTNELLLPIVDKVYTALNSGPVSGTDEAFLLSGLKKTYLTWLGAIFNSDLDPVFLSQTNSPHIQNIIRTVITLTADYSNPPIQKLAFGIIHRTIIGWLIDTQGDYTLGTISLMALGSQIPGSGNKNDVSGNLKKASNNTKPSSLPLNSEINQFVKERTMRQIAGEALDVFYDSQESLEFRSAYTLFLQQEVLPICFQVPSSKQFSLTDAQSSQTLTEICGVLRGFVLAGQSDAGRILLPKSRIDPIINIPAGQSITLDLERDAIVRNKMATFLFYEFLPKMGCNEYSALSFAKALLFLGSREFKRFFQEFISQAKA